MIKHDVWQLNEQFFEKNSPALYYDSMVQVDNSIKSMLAQRSVHKSSSVSYICRTRRLQCTLIT